MAPRTGSKRRHSSSAPTSLAPGRVLWAPRSSTSAPCCNCRFASRTAASTSVKRPPSLKESGVMLITPITAVRCRQPSGQWRLTSTGLVIGNPGETVGFERCTTDQDAVDITHGHEFIDVGGLHGSAVLNDQIGGSHPASDQSADPVGFGCFAGLTRADGPDRFIGHNKFVGVQPFKSLLDLSADHPLRFTPFALLITFSNTDDGDQPLGLGAAGPVVDLLITFAEVFAGLAVPNDCVCNAN